MDIGTLISNVGFPIAACCGMAWFIGSKIEKMDDSIGRMEKTITELSTTIRILIGEEHDV